MQQNTNENIDTGGDFSNAVVNANNMRRDQFTAQSHTPRPSNERGTFYNHDRLEIQMLYKVTENKAIFPFLILKSSLSLQTQILNSNKISRHKRSHLMSWSHGLPGQDLTFQCLLK